MKIQIFILTILAPLGLLTCGLEKESDNGSILSQREVDIEKLPFLTKLKKADTVLYIIGEQHDSKEANQIQDQIRDRIQTSTGESFGAEGFVSGSLIEAAIKKSNGENRFFGLEDAATLAIVSLTFVADLADTLYLLSEVDPKKIDATDYQLLRERTMAFLDVTTDKSVSSWIKAGISAVEKDPKKDWLFLHIANEHLKKGTGIKDSFELLKLNKMSINCIFDPDHLPSSDQLLKFRSSLNLILLVAAADSTVDEKTRKMIISFVKDENIVHERFLISLRSQMFVEKTESFRKQKMPKTIFLIIGKYHRPEVVNLLKTKFNWQITYSSSYDQEVKEFTTRVNEAKEDLKTRPEVLTTKKPDEINYFNSQLDLIKKLSAK